MITVSRRLGLALLVLGFASANAQERVVAPLPSLAPLIDRVAPAVVNIAVTELREASTSQGPFRRQQPDPGNLFGNRGEREERPPQEQFGAGSGVIVDAELGYVLTNNHVVADASDILITLSDNRSFEATVLGKDSHSDLAVLQIEPDNLTAIPFMNSSDLQVGDYVVAIGNPYGLSNTVTAGIVSGLGRQFINNNEFYEDFIQTDASINPGNSGGALVNLEGGLVGINAAIFSESGGNVGIGFAIPSEMVMAVMDRLLESGEVQRSLLGVSIDSVTPRFAADYGLNVQSGALVMSVGEDSAADRAGIRINDVITGVAGKPVADSNQLRNTVSMIPPGQEVSVQIIRGGRERSLTAVLDFNDQFEDEEEAPGEPLSPPAPLDGLAFSPLPARSGGPGLRIDNISPQDPRLLALMRDQLLLVGDLVTAINQQPVTTVDAAKAIVEDKRNIVLEVQRDSQRRLVRLR